MVNIQMRVTAVMRSKRHPYKTMASGGIPKILFQTSRGTKPGENLILNSRIFARDWKYYHFSDSDIITYFIQNPLPEFPNIISVFNCIKKGAHKADLFRYYFMYINGGVFQDDDFVIHDDLSRLLHADTSGEVSRYDFMCVMTHHGAIKSIFNGFLGASPKHPIIYDALKHIYNCDPKELDIHYLLICDELFKIVKRYTGESKILFFHEDGPMKTFGFGYNTLTQNEVLVGTHYPSVKVVPKVLSVHDTKIGSIVARVSDDQIFNSCYKHTYSIGMSVEYLPRNANIFVIGAGNGMSVIYYTKLVCNSTVYAFEPQLLSYRQMEHNLQEHGIDKRCITFNVALFSDAVGETINMSSIDVLEPNKTPILSREHVESGGIGYSRLTVGNNGELVKCKTLDSFIDTVDRVHFIECTAQGSEAFIFSSGKAFLRKHKPIIALSDPTSLSSHIASEAVSAAYPAAGHHADFDLVKFCVEELSYKSIIHAPFGNEEMILLLPFYTQSLRPSPQIPTESILNFFDCDKFRVYKSPFSLQRVGPECGGGYAIASNLPFKYDLFVSCGIVSNAAFEESLISLNPGLKGFVFDGTVSSFAQNTCKSVVEATTLVSRNVNFFINHANTNILEFLPSETRNMFLKMDIKGGEYNWLAFVANCEVLSRFIQIVIEIHYPFDEFRFSALSKLFETHVLIHIHGNNNGEKISFGNNSMPEIFSMTLLRKDVWCDSEPVLKESQCFPDPLLDFPCVIDKDELAFKITDVNM